MTTGGPWLFAGWSYSLVRRYIPLCLKGGTHGPYKLWQYKNTENYTSKRKVEICVGIVIAALQLPYRYSAAVVSRDTLERPGRSDSRY